MLSKDIWDLIVEEAYQSLEEQSEMIVEDNSESLPQRGLPSRGRTLHDTGQSNAKLHLQIIDGKAQNED